MSIGHIYMLAEISAFSVKYGPLYISAQSLVNLAIILPEFRLYEPYGGLVKLYHNMGIFAVEFPLPVLARFLHKSVRVS